jgi:quinohemoprotein ethanol dehydrogenase
MAAKTWSGDHWWEAGGGAAWDAITYDESTGLVIYGTAGPGNGRNYALQPQGDRLFSNCIIAVKAATGEYAWHFQTGKLVPKDDSPENFHVIVTDLIIAGVKRHVAMTVPRFGAFILLDATSGGLISWKSMSDRPAAQRSPPTADGLPRSATAKNWWPMSYNPGTGLAYVPLYDHPDGIVHDLLRDAVGRLVAWDPLKQEARWSISQPLAINGGVLSTAGNLVIQGEGTGELSAYAADSGHKLWSVKTGSAIQGIPVTYTLEGQQYVLVPVGLGGGTRLFSRTSAMATPQSKRGPARLLAFALGANTTFPYPRVEIPVVPKPPAQTASAVTVKHGREVLDKFLCWGCHGGLALDGAGAWVLNGAVPDLRYMPQDVHDQFPAIVLGGSHRQNGMPGFADGHPNWPVTDTMSL